MGCPQSKQSPPPAVALPPPAQVVAQPAAPAPKPSKKAAHAPSSTLTIAFCRDVPTDELARRVAEHRGVTRVLRVEASRLGAGGGAQLSRAVVHGPRASALVGLSLAHCGLSTAGCVAVARAFLETRLASLDLSGNDVRAEGVVALAAAVRGRGGRGAWGPPGSRVELQLAENPLVGSPPHVGVAAVAELVAALAEAAPRRKALGLAAVGLRFGGDSAPGRALLDQLARSRFAHVDLRHNRLDDAAARALAAALSARTAREPPADAEPGVDADAALAAAIGALDDRHPLAPVQPAFGLLDGRGDGPFWTTASVAEVLSGAAKARVAERDVADVARARGLLATDGTVDGDAWRGFAALALAAARGEAGAGPLERLDLRGNPISVDGEAALKDAWKDLRAAASDRCPGFPTGPAPQLLILDASSDARDVNRRAAARLRDVTLSLANRPEPPRPTAPAPVASKPAARPGRADLWRTIAQLLCDLEDAGSDLTALFASWDSTGDGEISLREFHSGLSNLPGDDFAAFTPEDAAALVREAMDKDGDAHVSLAEFLGFAQRGRRALAGSRLSFEQQVAAPLATPAPAPAPPPAAAPPALRDPKLWPAAAIKICKLLVIFENGGQSLREAFAAFDASKDGELSAGELHRGLAALPGGVFADLDVDDVKQLFADCLDADDDGHVSLGEFVDFVERGKRGLGDAVLGVAKATTPKATTPTASTPTASTPAPPKRSFFDDDEPVPARRLSDQSARVAKLLILYEDAGNSLKDAFDKFDKSGDGNISIHELLVGLQGLGAAFANISREEVEKIVIDAFDKDLDDAHISLHEFTEFVKRARAEG